MKFIFVEGISIIESIVVFKNVLPHFVCRIINLIQKKIDQNITYINEARKLFYGCMIVVFLE